MTALAIRKTAWAALSDRDKTILRFMGDKLALGVPAQFLDGAANEWYVFDDHRFRAKPVAYFGCVAANLGDIPGGYSIPMIDLLDEDGVPTGEQVLDRATLVDDIKSFCENPARTHPLVLPKDVVFPDDDPNPWQTLLDAQGTPAAMKMASGVPASWSPVEVEGP